MCCKKRLIESIIFTNDVWKKRVIKEGNNNKATPIKVEFVSSKGWNQATDANQIPNQEGVYCFVAKNDIQVNAKEIFRPFLMIDCQLMTHLVCLPQMNNFALNSSNIIEIKKNDIIYVGETNDLKKRYNQHISGKIDKTNSMKLGLINVFNDNIDYYYQIIRGNGKTMLEQSIRNNNGCWFGR